MSNPVIPFEVYVSRFTDIVVALTREETKMSLISKIEEEFGLLRAFLVSTLGDHFHIHIGVDDALDAVRGIVSEHTGEPVTSEGAEAAPAPPSTPVSEEVPTPAQPSDTEAK
jgi:hypothetical protein